MEKESPTLPNLMTVAQFSAAYPAFSQPALRHMIFKKETSGLDKAIYTIGRKVLINVDKFF